MPGYINFVHEQPLSVNSNGRSGRRYLSTVTWSATPSDLASVDGTGWLWVDSPGTVTVTAKNPESGVTGTFTVTVKDPMVALEKVKSYAASSGGTFLTLQDLKDTSVSGIVDANFDVYSKVIAGASTAYGPLTTFSELYNQTQSLINGFTPNASINRALIQLDSDYLYGLVGCWPLYGGRKQCKFGKTSCLPKLYRLVQPLPDKRFCHVGFGKTCA